MAVLLQEHRTAPGTGASQQTAKTAPDGTNLPHGSSAAPVPLLCPTAVIDAAASSQQWPFVHLFTTPRALPSPRVQTYFGRPGRAGQPRPTNAAAHRTETTCWTRRCGSPGDTPTGTAERLKLAQKRLHKTQLRWEWMRHRTAEHTADLQAHEKGHVLVAYCGERSEKCLQNTRMNRKNLASTLRISHAPQPGSGLMSVDEKLMKRHVLTLTDKLHPENYMHGF